MSLKECAPWLFGRVFSNSKGREISLSEAMAVQRLFSSLLSKAEAEAEKEAKKKYGIHGHLPLQCIAMHAKGRYAVAVFTAVFKAYPSAAKEKGYNGCLPLHYVALNMGAADGGLEAIQLLLREYPKAAAEKTSGGNLPIHCICYNTKANLAMVLELLSAHPQSINEKGYDGKKPYALAAAYKLPADAIEFLRCTEQGVAT
jgi:hypothetical protein